MYRVLQCYTLGIQRPTHLHRLHYCSERSVIPTLKAICISVLMSLCVNRPISVNDPHETITFLFLTKQTEI
jgi:hypothetical protein